MDETCSICGDSLKNDFSHTLDCNHTYHYQCILQSFKLMNNNECPYCRSNPHLLPLVNGLKKVYEGIHDTTNLNEFSNHTCNMILTRGKNKGKNCSRNCLLGRDYCKTHFNMVNKDKMASNTKNKINKD